MNYVNLKRKQFIGLKERIQDRKNIEENLTELENLKKELELKLKEMTNVISC